MTSTEKVKLIKGKLNKLQHYKANAQNNYLIERKSEKDTSCYDVTTTLSWQAFHAFHK